MEKEKFDPLTIAAFRFGVIGRLLADPPLHGDLVRRLKDVCSRPWPHPITKDPWLISLRSVERWYYAATKSAATPIESLVPKGRPSDGHGYEMKPALRELLADQFARHKNWAYQLHADNLVAAAKADPNLGAVPSYSTIKRYMKSVGLYRRKGWRPSNTAGQVAAEARLEALEVRSYEVAHVGGLWHTDFHHGSILIRIASGDSVTPHVVRVFGRPR